MPSNLAGSSGNVQKRQFLLQGTDLSAPNPYRVPTLPAAPGSPATPVFPGTLTGPELSEVNNWLAAPEGQRPDLLRRARTRAAIAKIGEYVVYYADPAVIAWLAAVNDARFAQHVLGRADGIINNEATTAKSSDVTGAGSTPPPAYQPPGSNTP